MTPDAADAALPPACVVYGGGTFGQMLVGELAGVGVQVVAVVDRVVTDSQREPPILHPESVPGLGEYPVVLGVCNPQASPGAIAGYLRNLGCAEIWSPASLFAALGRAGRTREHYWLTTDIDLYDREAALIDEARAQLADERSAALFTSLLLYRTTGDIGALPEVDPLEFQYRPADVDFIEGTVSLLDAGAYDGDTVRAFVGAGVDIESVVAFEPDPANFDRLTQELAGHEQMVSVALPLALGRRTERAWFSATGTASAAIGQSGDGWIQCVSVDGTLRGWPLTHVKMDIEGAEPDALGGMERLLATTRPRLAVSAYHRPEHLWSLLLQLAALDLGYRFHIRCYGEQCFDSVLYAVPA